MEGKLWTIHLTNNSLLIVKVNGHICMKMCEFLSDVQEMELIVCASVENTICHNIYRSLHRRANDCDASSFQSKLLLQ